MKEYFITDYDNKEEKEKRFEKGFTLSYEDIKTTEPIKNDEDFIFGYISLDLDDDLNPENIPAFYCFKKEEIDGKTFDFTIENQEDIKYEQFPISYGLMFLDWEEILGYNVIPYFEQVSELELAAQLLWELTWFGYTKEDYNKNAQTESKELQSRSEEAEQAIKDGNKEYFISWDEVKEELFNEMYSDLTDEEKIKQKEEDDKHLQEFLEKSKELNVDNTKNILKGFKAIVNIMD